MARTWRTSRGFTFLELLLVAFVVLTAISGILGSYASTHFLSQQARELMMANDDLRDMMEHVNATAFAALPTLFPPGAGNANGYQTIVSGQTGGTPNPFVLPGETITVTYPSQTATRREMLVTITWTNRGGQRSASLAGLRTSSS